MNAPDVELYVLHRNVDVSLFMNRAYNVRNLAAWSIDLGYFDSLSMQMKGIVIRRMQRPRFTITIQPFRIRVVRIDDDNIMDSLADLAVLPYTKWSFQIGRAISVFWRHKLISWFKRRLYEIRGRSLG